MKQLEPLRGDAIPENAREVDLPVCEHCGLVSRQAGQGTAKAWCQGPRDARHKKTQMRPVTYRAQ